MIAPLRICSHLRCTERVRGSSRCPAHTRAYDRQRGTAAERGYDSRWAAYSRARLRRLPWCGQREDGTISREHSRCAQQGREELATVTDHIIPHRGDQRKFWDDQNMQSLCASCHSAKTATEDGGFGRVD